MYGLKTSDIERIKSVFANYSEIDKVILYGSRAKGNYQNSSDIDLSIVGDIDLDKILKIETILVDLLLPYHIALCVLKKIENSDLLDHINRVGVVFYKNSIKEFQLTNPF